MGVRSNQNNPMLGKSLGRDAWMRSGGRDAYSRQRRTRVSAFSGPKTSPLNREWMPRAPTRRSAHFALRRSLTSRSRARRPSRSPSHELWPTFKRPCVRGASGEKEFARSRGVRSGFCAPDVRPRLRDRAERAARCVLRPHRRLFTARGGGRRRRNPSSAPGAAAAAGAETHWGLSGCLRACFLDKLAPALDV